MSNPSRTAELEEIWALFAQESQDNLAAAEAALLELEHARADAEQIKALFRALHSFKGAARMMGLAVVESLAHHAEDLIALVRDDGVPLEAAMIELILQVIDRLRALLNNVIVDGHDADAAQVADLVTSLQAMSTRATDAPAQATRANEPAPAITLEASAPPPMDASVAAVNDPREFLPAVENWLNHFYRATDALIAGATDTLTEFEAMVRDLKGTAERLGYLRLGSVLDEWQTTARAEMDADARRIHLKKLELTLFEEFTHIQQADAETDWTNIVWLFRHWHAEHISTDLAGLREIAERLDQLAQSPVACAASSECVQLADAATRHLRAIYHSANFYQLASVAQLALTLADLYARVVNGEVMINAALTRLTRDGAAELHRAITAACEDQEPEPGALATLLEQAQNFLYLNTASHGLRVSQNILDLLSLPVEFKQAMTSETIAKFNRAHQAGEHFYTILADLDSDPALGMAFFEWSCADDLHLITNVTVYRYQRTLFNFLLATPRARAAVLQSLIALDPDWQSLTLVECTLRAEAMPAPAEPKTIASPIEIGSRDIAGVLPETLQDLSGAVGALAAHHATLRRIANRLNNAEMAEEIIRIIGATQGEWHARLNAWNEDTRALVQVENQMGVALEHLQEATRALRLAPVAEWLNPLQQMIHELAQAQGKHIELDWRASDLQMDRSALQKLAEPIRQLARLAATHSIETVEARRTAGKPASAHLTVQVNARDNHIQVVIQDDGRGIHHAEIDWATWHAELRAQQGRLLVNDTASPGARFEISFPLDLAALDGIVVRVGAVRYVVPVHAIQKIVAADATQIVHSSAGEKQSMLRFEGGLVPIRTLGKNGHANDPQRAFDGKLFVVVEGERARMAWTIDELLERQQVLVQPLEGQLAETPNAVGCALLGEGEVGVVLGVN